MRRPTPDVFGDVAAIHLLDIQSLCQRLAALAQFLVFDAAREFVTAALERLVNGLRAGCQTPLQGREGEAHCALALAVELVGTVHFLLHIVRDGSVQRGFGVR